MGQGYYIENCNFVPNPKVVYPMIHLRSKDGSVTIKKDGPYVWDLSVGDLPDPGQPITTIITSSTQTVNLTGTGEVSTPLAANIRISAVANNAITLQSDGLYVNTNVGNINSVAGTVNRITVTAGANPVLDISPLYVGQSSISILGTITTGFWNAAPIGTAYGGVPSGGNTGQVLVKNTGNNYDASWQNPSSSSITGDIEIFTALAGEDTFTPVGTLPISEFKISVYRNGVDVEFTLSGNDIVLDEPADENDKIKIKWFD